MGAIKKKPFIPEGTQFYMDFPDGDREVAIYNNGLLVVERDTYYYQFEIGNILKHEGIILTKITELQLLN